jgi:hypothetical protein
MTRVLGGTLERASDDRPTVGRVLGWTHHAAAVLGDHLQRLVDVVGAEEDDPV